LNHREKELAAVKINAADVDIIANELEVTSSTDCTEIYLEIYLHSNQLTYFSYITVGQKGG
jgi:hypothetical protein